MSNILSEQVKLQGEARKLLKSTQLLPILERLGEVHQTGSSITGLMTYRDIDFTIHSKNPNLEDTVKLVNSVFDNLSAVALKVGIVDNNKQKPVMYIGFDFPFNNNKWHIDATICKPGSITTNPPELAGWIEKMTKDQQETILRLKNELINSKRYVGSRSQPPYTFRSIHLYEAVLVGNAKTIKEAEDYFKKSLS